MGAVRIDVRARLPIRQVTANLNAQTDHKRPSIF
jgi:hypothetical protein